MQKWKIYSVKSSTVDFTDIDFSGNNIPLMCDSSRVGPGTGHLFSVQFSS